MTKSLEKLNLNKVVSIEAKIYGEVQEDDSCYYQNFRIVTSDFRFLKYFTDDKFLGYYTLCDAMANNYIGDGEKIIYSKKIILNNLVTIVYDKINTSYREFPSIQFKVSTHIPFEEGCSCCDYWRNNNRRCLYYMQMGIEKKTNCQDFKQKEVIIC